MTFYDTSGHMLKVLPKLADDVNTVSGKCECGELLGAAPVLSDIEARWQTHIDAQDLPPLHGMFATPEEDHDIEPPVTEAAREGMADDAARKAAEG